MKEWTPNSSYGGHAFGFTGDQEDGKSQFQEFLEGREKILPWIKEYSPYELVTADDPPVFLFYSGAAGPGPGAEGPDAHRQFRREAPGEVPERGRRVLSGLSR